MFNDGDIVCIFLRNRVSRFRQKIIQWRAGAIFLVHARKKMCIIRQPVKLFTKNDNSVNFSQIFPQIFSQTVKFSVKFFVKKFYQFYVHIDVELYIRWRKTGMLNFFVYHTNVKNTRASSFYHCFTILCSRRCGIICTCFFKKLNFLSCVPPLI